MEPLAEHRQQYLVVDVVEAPFDVALDEPADTGPVGRHVAQGGVATPAGPKAMGTVGKLRLVVGFQNHPDDLLQQLVRPCRYAQSAGLAVRLGNVDPSHRRPPEPLVAQGFDDAVDFRQ